MSRRIRVTKRSDSSLPEVVKCDREGRPDAINYSRVGLHLVPEVSENRDRVESVEAVSNQCAETIDDLRSDLSARDARLADQADRIEQLAAENAQLTDRLTRLEGQLGTDGAVTGTTPADD
jgi:predicted nuclease with TOPRIM domain